jgi:hypothetical protein
MQALRDNEACALEEYDAILDVCDWRSGTGLHHAWPLIEDMLVRAT